MELRNSSKKNSAKKERIEKIRFGPSDFIKGINFIIEKII